MCRVVRPFVEKYVAESCADNRTDQKVGQQDAEPAFGCAFVLEHACHDVVAYKESDGESESIPAQGKGTYAEDFRRCVPVYKVGEHIYEIGVGAEGD